MNGRAINEWGGGCSRGLLIMKKGIYFPMVIKLEGIGVKTMAWPLKREFFAASLRILLKLKIISLKPLIERKKHTF